MAGNTAFPRHFKIEANRTRFKTLNTGFRLRHVDALRHSRTLPPKQRAAVVRGAFEQFHTSVYKAIGDGLSIPWLDNPESLGHLELAYERAAEGNSTILHLLANCAKDREGLLHALMPSADCKCKTVVHVALGLGAGLAPDEGPMWKEVLGGNHRALNDPGLPVSQHDRTPQCPAATGGPEDECDEGLDDFDLQDVADTIYESSLWISHTAGYDNVVMAVGNEGGRCLFGRAFNRHIRGRYGRKGLRFVAPKLARLVKRAIFLCHPLLWRDMMGCDGFRAIFLESLVAAYTLVSDVDEEGMRRRLLGRMDDLVSHMSIAFGCGRFSAAAASWRRLGGKRGIRTRMRALGYDPDNMEDFSEFMAALGRVGGQRSAELRRLEGTMELHAQAMGLQASRKMRRRLARFFCALGSAFWHGRHWQLRSLAELLVLSRAKDTKGAAYNERVRLGLQEDTDTWAKVCFDYVLDRVDTLEGFLRHVDEGKSAPDFAPGCMTRWEWRPRTTSTHTATEIAALRFLSDGDLMGHAWEPITRAVTVWHNQPKCPPVPPGTSEEEACGLVLAAEGVLRDELRDLEDEKRRLKNTLKSLRKSGARKEVRRVKELVKEKGLKVAALKRKISTLRYPNYKSISKAWTDFDDRGWGPDRRTREARPDYFAVGLPAPAPPPPPPSHLSLEAMLGYREVAVGSTVAAPAPAAPPPPPSPKKRKLGSGPAAPPPPTKKRTLGSGPAPPPPPPKKRKLGSGPAAPPLPPSPKKRKLGSGPAAPPPPTKKRTLGSGPAPQLTKKHSNKALAMLGYRAV